MKCKSNFVSADQDPTLNRKKKGGRGKGKSWKKPDLSSSSRGLFVANGKFVLCVSEVLALAE